MTQVTVTPRDNALLPGGGQVTLRSGETAVFDVALKPRHYGNLEVTVRDALTLQPIAGVSLQGPPTPATETKTGPDGTYLFTGVYTQNQPQPVSVFATLPGFWFNFGTVTVTPDQTAHMEIKITRESAPATVTGRVLNAVTGAPLELATVAKTNSPFEYVVTDVNGRFTWSGIRLTNNVAFSQSFTANKDGFLPTTKVVNIYCGARITADFGTPDTGHASLSGVVTAAATGQPVAGALVGSEWGTTATTDAAGAYSFADVPMGGEVSAKTWHLDALAPPGSPLITLTKNVTVHPNQNSVLDFALGVSTNHRPVVQDVHVTVPSTTSFVPLLLTGTDADGDKLQFRMFTPTGGEINNQDVSGGVNFTLAAGATEGRYWYLATDGQVDSVPAQVIITRGAPPANVPPTALITGPTSAPEGSSVVLSVTGSDSDGTVVSNAWDTNGDNVFDNGSASTISIARADDAVVPVAAQVTDDKGATGIATHTVTFTNVPPVANIGGPAALDTGTSLTRSGSFFDPGADTWTATVDYGDGAGPTAARVAGNRRERVGDVDVLARAPVHEGRHVRRARPRVRRRRRLWLGNVPGDGRGSAAAHTGRRSLDRQAPHR